MMILYRVICIVVGYAFGLFQTGYILGRMKGIDIRKYGSGNAGTTNAKRVLGKKLGSLVYVGDCLKAIICCTIVRFVFMQIAPEFAGLFVLYAGLGVVLGHNYPFYMGFKGGKGIAATSGVVIAFGDWRVILICLVVYFVVVKTTKYVSLGSLCVVTCFLINMICWGQLEHLGFPGYYIPKNQLLECYIVSFVFTASAFYMHKKNIVRLLNGTERKQGDTLEEEKVNQELQSTNK